MNILITSIGTSTSVGVIKALRKWQKDNDFDLRIIGTDINPFGYTAFSQKVDGFYQVPLANDTHYEDVVMKILEKESVELFWPIHDYEIRIASEWRLPDNCKLFTPAFDVIDIVQDKLVATKKMIEMGIPVPEQIYDDYDGKVIIRKRRGVGSTGIKVVNSIAKDEIPEDSFAQKYIDGAEYTVDCLSDSNGAPLYIVPRRRLEIKSGVATKSCIEKNDMLIEYTHTIMTSLKIPGFSNTQWIVSDNSPHYIETNPRIGGGTSATLIAAPHMFDSFMRLVVDDKIDRYKGLFSTTLNSDVKWGSIITRYYEEVIYLPE